MSTKRSVQADGPPCTHCVNLRIRPLSSLGGRRSYSIIQFNTLGNWGPTYAHLEDVFGGRARRVSGADEGRVEACDIGLAFAPRLDERHCLHERMSAICTVALRFSPVFNLAIPTFHNGNIFFLHIGRPWGWWLITWLS